MKHNKKKLSYFSASWLGFLSFLIVCIVSGIFLYENYQAERHIALNLSQNYAWVLEEHANSTFQKADQVLLAISLSLKDSDFDAKSLARQKTRAARIHDLVKSWKAENKNLDLINIHDKHGNLLYSSKEPLPKINNADRSYFKKIRDNPELVRVFSEPLISRSTGKPSIIMARRMVAKDGQFLGTVQVNLGLNLFTQLYRAIAPGQHSLVAMHSLDGFHRMARYPEISEQQSPLSSPMNHPLQVFFTGNQFIRSADIVSPLDGEFRLVSFRKLSDYPFFIEVGVSAKDYLAAWRKRLVYFAAGLIFFAVLVVLFVRRLNQIQHNLLKTRNMLAEAQRIAQVGSWDWDVVNAKLEWSDEAYRLFDTEPDDKPSYDGFLAVVHPDDRKMVMNAVQDALADHRPYHIIHRVLGKTGTERIVQAQGKVFRDSKGKAIRMVGTTQDITEQQRIENELRHAKKLAESANQAKSAFLANMSHELRTPLNAILGFSRLMAKDEDIHPAQKENLRIINRSGEHLLEMINEILDLSKIEAGRMKLEPAAIDLRQLLQDVSDMVRSRGEAKGLYFQLQTDSTLPHYVSVDPSKLRQILINLLGNAVKFTDQGGITLSASCTSLLEQPERCQLNVEVADTGRGIEMAMQERVFEPFVQADVNVTEQQQGTGLGLAITRTYVQMMGGSIGLESVPGQGSLFRFQIPLDIVEASQVAVQEQDKRVVLGLALGEKSRKILVTDDNADNRLLLTRLLSRVGFEVLEAKNGLEAVEQFAQHQPDLIWMDIRMPVMDGSQAMERIRQLPGGKQVKIVALTASVFKQERDKLLAYGFDDVHHKPYREGELFQMMAELLNLHYRYAEEQRSADKIVQPLPQLLKQVDRQLLEPIKAAALRGSGKQLKDALMPLAEEHQEAIAALTLMAEAYRFDEIIALINDLETFEVGK